jgi:hypothetical protein
MAQIYCGNNSLHPDLVNGIKVLGSRYQCLRKGIGTGLNLPLDPDYGGPYAPIDNRRIYCGNAVVLPDGYDSMGNLSQCLQKGVGIGKLQRAEDGFGDDSENDGYIKRSRKSIWIKIVIQIMIFIILYLWKPSFVTYLNEKNQVTIDWKMFLLYYFLICVFIFFILHICKFK